ncbi:seryl-tRNA synthetase [Capronia epimyces CBS 606.96]|uniref:serine--tRNA ligase n=1 Tax=Capronia epimyces CBS 606.96 TaxID=1182542 RepID=W9YPP9_9EURO|nr:seryl-tRNA synthetase [Capronia epimyces CBS 606.96]EXJ84239.1 seryl-tRNA synthetase [Capronia epimyces CBS 606.96]
MIDILDLIVERGGNPELACQSLRKRYADESLVHEVIGLWQDAYSARYRAQQARAQMNQTQREIGHMHRSGQDPTTLLAKKDKLDEEIKALEHEATRREDLRDRRCKLIPNYVHESVPISENEDMNEVVASWTPAGVELKKKDCLAHHEVMTRAGDSADSRKITGAKLVGHRGYFLRKWGVFFNQALINYGLHFLYAKGYDPIQPPFFMKSEYMAKTAQLDDFEESLYRVVENNRPDSNSDAKYLIATSEQPLSAMYADEWLAESDLPQKLAGYSSCFRKEAGSHGRDAWGLFRVHQFEKIEQFLFVKPEDSWQSLEDMKSVAEEFYQSLGLAYRVVAIVSGALNNAAAKKYDLEAWFPHQGEYKELVSCTNCTDYQTRELNIRYRPKETKADTGVRKAYCHALNGTLCATERTLCCLLENYQTDQGVVVPDALKPYMPPGTPDLIPYTTDLPRHMGAKKEKEPR